MKSILKNDKSVTVFKSKFTERVEDVIKAKPSRTLPGIRLAPVRKPASTKTGNETIVKTIEVAKKPTCKPPTQESKAKTRTSTVVQTKLTTQPSVVLGKPLRGRIENNGPKKEITLKEKQTEISITRNSLRNRESISKEPLKPSVVLQKVDIISRPKSSTGIVPNINNESSTAERETKPSRRSSARLSLRKSLTADKSSESNSLYVSALEDM